MIFLGALAVTAGLGLTSPIMLAIVPTLGARMVSSQLAYTGFLYHYNATLMVICFAALCDGIVRHRRRSPIRRGRPPGSGRLLRAQWVLLAGVVAVSVVRAPTVPSIASVFASCARCVAADTAITQIPDGARVVADVFLMPHLVDRTQVMQAYPGFVDTTGLPLRADWVILDLDSTSYAPGPLTTRADQLGWSRTLLDSLVASGHFAVVDRPGPYVVLRSVG